MVNQRLATALAAAHVDIEEIARITGVDSKTVRRWLGGRTPHPRSQHAIAKFLNEREDYLWPSEGVDPHDRDRTSEVVAAFAHRADVLPPAWWDQFREARERVDLLGYALHFLPEQLPELPSLLKDKGYSTCSIRIAIGDPDSPRIRERDNEEQLGGTLPSRIRSTLRHLRVLHGCEGVEIRFHDAPLYNSIFRWDDQMYVTPHLYSVHGSKAPLFHLRRLSLSGIFENFMTHFEAIWAVARPVTPTELPEHPVSVSPRIIVSPTEPRDSREGDAWIKS